jgi:hypothetical protein
MNYITDTKPDTVAGVARSAMMVDLHISVYSGRKQDKATQGEVTTAKGSGSKKAASVYKNLFAECKELDDLTKFQARARAEHYRLTLPWNDQGARLLPTASLLEYQQVMGRYRNEFERLVDAFLDKYDTLVAAAAFQLGTLFDRKEYLSRAQVALRFRMESSFTPLPTSGDFRLDVESTVQRELIEQYERRMEAKLAQANQDSWSRLHEALLRLSDRLVIEEDGKKRKFHDTMVTGALELCELLTVMNVTHDPELEKARRKVEEVLSGVTPKELRDEHSTRIQTKQRVDAILDAFDWGVDSGEAELEG